MSSAPRQRGWFPLPVAKDLPDLVGPAPAGVVPHAVGTARQPRRRPRASGGGSSRPSSTEGVTESAPRQRGWFVVVLLSAHGRHVGPAPAGVVPPPPAGNAVAPCRPRASGGGSQRRQEGRSGSESAPRQRGWFQVSPENDPELLVGPAPAGVVLEHRYACTLPIRRPRASGGGSLSPRLGDGGDGSAPRQRGWFRAAPWRPRPSVVGPAPAGVVLWSRHPVEEGGCRPRASGGGSLYADRHRIEITSAPRQRGWFEAETLNRIGLRVGPAPAGVVRRTPSPSCSPGGRPRASGGGSTRPAAVRPVGGSAPRQRGWFAPRPARRDVVPVGPAPAGVVPAPPCTARRRARRPRASGGGSASEHRARLDRPSAPRQRGWFAWTMGVHGLGLVGPAPAGVVLQNLSHRHPSTCRPRASGGGSFGAQAYLQVMSSAPRQRGWFVPHVRFDVHPNVGPAPAGVVPRSASGSGRPDSRPRASGGGSRP